jgi:D-beta-D-heptose 7-phosphate kinase/D-beta-D-heptose 1-phosphate adenosyltransferase
LSILLLGDLIRDVWLIGSVSRMSPEDSSIPVLDVTETKVTPGGAGNVHLNLVAAGQAVDMCVGTTVCEKFRGIAGNRQAFRYDPPIGHSAGDDTLWQVLSHGVRPTGNKAVVIADYGKGRLATGSREIVVSCAREQKIPLFVACKPDAVRQYVGAAFLKLNLSEALQTVSNNVHPALASKDKFEVAGVAGQAICRLGFHTVVVTLGGDGAVVVVDGKPEYVPLSGPVPVASVVGAGDAFFAAFIAATLAGHSAPFAAHVANEVTRLAVQRPFTVCFLPEEWQRVMKGP